MPRRTADRPKSSHKTSRHASDQWTDAERPQTTPSIFTLSSELRQVKSSRAWRDLGPDSEGAEASTRKGHYLYKLILMKMREDDDVREHLTAFFDVVDKLMELEVYINEELLCALLLSSLPSSLESAIVFRGEAVTLENLSKKIVQEGDARLAAGSSGVENKSNNTLEDSILRYKFKKLEEDGERENKNYSNFERGREGFLRLIDSNDYSPNAPEEYGYKLFWFLDSGSTSHLCNDVTKFQEFCECENKTLRMANGQPCEVIGSGTITIRPGKAFRGVDNSLKIKDVLCVPDLRINLVSISKITDEGKKVIFDESCARIIDEYGRELAKCHKRDGLYFIEEDYSEANTQLPLDGKIFEWHNRLGHLNIRDMRKLCKSGVLNQINLQSLPVDFHCEVCMSENMANPYFFWPDPENVKAQSLLEIIHTSVCGPLSVTSFGHKNYFVTFTDDLSRFAEVYFIRQKLEVLAKFIEFKARIETLLKRKIRFLQSDFGIEYHNKEFDDFLKVSGIRRRTVPPWRQDLHQNSVSEGKNRILMNTARCLLSQSGLPPYFWAEAVNTANFIRNRCPAASIGYKTPYEVLFKRKPYVGFLKTFGSLGCAFLKGPKGEKCGRRPARCIFLGYCSDVKGFRVYIPELDRLEILRAVKVTDGLFIRQSVDINRFL